MNPNDNLVQQLKIQITELNTKIDYLTTQKNEAALTVVRCGEELENLYTAQRHAQQQLKGMETSQCNMWENIGEGG